MITAASGAGYRSPDQQVHFTSHSHNYHPPRRPTAQYRPGCGCRRSEARAHRAGIVAVIDAMSVLRVRDSNRIVGFVLEVRAEQSRAAVGAFPLVSSMKLAMSSH